MSQNKLNAYLNLSVTFLERLFIIIIISTLLARIRVSVNWLYYLMKWIMMIPNGLVEEVKLQNEKWAHPHLIKELRGKF